MKGNDKMPTPGIGDPYWYEWYTGLEQVINMLDPDTNIKSVIFQYSEYDTVDDVVVEYVDGNTEICYQVKHEISTSNNNNLTFGKLLESKNGKPCLIKALFVGWKKAKDESKIINPVLYTNRKSLDRRAVRTFNGKSYSAYSINKFLELINREFDKEEFDIKDENLALQWEELCSKFDKTDIDDLVDFLKVLSVKANQPSLSEMKRTLISALSQKFSCTDSVAAELFNRLLGGLSVWTTTERTNEQVTVEDVYTALSIEGEIDDSQHRLVPPHPFFKSRETFCTELEQKILATDKNIVFISGEPGSGKTSIISYLQSNTNLFLLRYHTFRPISPEQRFYNADPGLCTSENLWGTLLTQLRIKFKGRIAECGVPVSNKLITVEMMRNHVLRLLKIVSEESIKENKKVYICIDGIDHAARSNSPVSFLGSLPLPNEIPEGVCLVIVGQPPALYQNQYPMWLASDTAVEHIALPKLCVNDIKQLVSAYMTQFENDLDGLATMIHQKTEGNNLSTVFLVEEIKNCLSLDEVVEKIQFSKITADIQQYYKHIWAYMTNELSKVIPATAFPESLVACPIILMNGRVDVKILSRAISGMSESDWLMTLNMLYPLVVPTENKDEFALFHNDFRVFLMSIISKYQSRYEEIAFALAKYILENDEGLLTYVMGIPLLQCANKCSLIPQYFTVGFVINALTEGVSLQRLDEFAHLSYDASCQNQDIEGYCNTYFAVKTLYQHSKYFEYYDRKYTCNDYPEISFIDISEIHTIPLSRDSLDEYRRVLTFCQKLFASSTLEHRSRAIGLYKKWFNCLTPLSFLAIGDDTVSEENFWKLKTTKIGFFLQQWGRITAELNMPVPEISKPSNILEATAITIFGEQYFEYCIENNKTELAVSVIEAHFIHIDALSDKLEKIYYSGALKHFEFTLDSIAINAESSLSKSLSLALKTICDSSYTVSESLLDSTKVKHIYDETSFLIVLNAFIYGYKNKENTDNDIVNGIESFCIELEDKEPTKSEMLLLSKISGLLGKYYWLDKSSGLFIESIRELLTVKLHRSFDYSRARLFLIYTLLSSQVVNSFNCAEWFLEAINTALFEVDLLGMHYKTYILEFLKQNNQLDIIHSYIKALYGENCSSMSLHENKVEMHNCFCPYGSLVEPEMMQNFSYKLKWDVVGYIGYKEYAMYDPSKCFDIIIQNDSSRWKDLGAILYRQSQIADFSSNNASYDIEKQLCKAAVDCGITDYWKLGSWDKDFSEKPYFIYQSLFEFIKKSENDSDLILIWILNCAINSWYTQDGCNGAKCIYDACVEQAKKLDVNFSEIISNITPQWLKILQNISVESVYNTEPNEYSKLKEKEFELFTKKCDALELAEILEILPSIKKLDYPLEYYKYIFRKIEFCETNKHDNFEIFLQEFCEYLTGKDWTHYQNETLIALLLGELKEIAFWCFANCIEKNLSDYDYQTSSRNMHLLLKLYFKMQPSSLQEFFIQEIKTQELWVSGNNHIEIDFDTCENRRNFPVPKTLAEMVLYIILEQIDSQNARKIESAMFSLSLLGELYPTIIDAISDIWENLTQMQEEILLLTIVKWASKNLCSKKLSDLLYNKYISCSKLSKKYLLHSILLKLSIQDVESERISVEANAANINLPSCGEKDTKSYCDFFFSLVPKDEPETIDSIKRFIAKNQPLTQYIDDKYLDDGDSRIPTYSTELDEILYNVEKEGKWDSVPLVQKKSGIMLAEDPFILTEMPTVVFDEEWFPDTTNTYSTSGNEVISNEQLLKIIQNGVPNDKVLLAGSLWYPWGRKDGAICLLTSKIDTIFSFFFQDEMDWSVGNYGVLANEGTICETNYSEINFGGTSLFNRVGGCLKIIFGNSQMVPSAFWKNCLKCFPCEDNPYIWVNQQGKKVLWFERIVSPIRKTTRESYIRQPNLFRWICDSEWLNNFLKDNGLVLRYISSFESYPQ